MKKEKTDQDVEQMLNIGRKDDTADMKQLKV